MKVYLITPAEIKEIEDALMGCKALLLGEPLEQPIHNLLSALAVVRAIYSTQLEPKPSQESLAQRLSNLEAEVKVGVADGCR